MNLPPNEPVNTLFSEIDKLSTIAELAKAPMSEQQKINMGYLLLQKMHVYSTALTKWDQKDEDARTWENFKIHFREAQKALCRTGSLTVNETINHADIVNLIQQGVQLAMVEKESLNNTCIATDYSSHQESANSVTLDITLQTLQQQLDLMKQMMEAMQNMNQSKNSNKKRNPNQTEYCWTHGLYNHTGNQCRTPADRHVKEAMVSNRMGGSIKNIKEL